MTTPDFLVKAKLIWQQNWKHTPFKHEQHVRYIYIYQPKEVKEDQEITRVFGLLVPLFCIFHFVFSDHHGEQ